MKRREFLGGLAAAASVAYQARSQPLVGVKRIGILTPFSQTDAETRTHIATFRSELAKLGWTEGRGLQIEFRWGDGVPARIATAANELVALKPDVLLCRSTPVAKSLAEATRTIPVIFVVVSDPVGDGLVASITRPGGNLTGFTNVEASLGGKWIGLLREIAPSVTQVSILFNPKTSPSGGAYYMRLIDDASRQTPLKISAVPVDDEADIKASIDRTGREQNSGMVILPDVLTTGHRKLIIQMASQYRLPTIYAYRYITAEGGLASYGVDVGDLYRRAAGYTDRLLRGESVAELPVQAPVKFDLAINLKAARDLGLTIAPTLLALADEVIE